MLQIIVALELSSISIWIKLKLILPCRRVAVNEILIIEQLLFDVCYCYYCYTILLTSCSWDYCTFNVLIMLKFLAINVLHCFHLILNFVFIFGSMIFPLFLSSCKNNHNFSLRFRKILPCAFTPHENQLAKEVKKPATKKKAPPQALKVNI